MIERDEWTVAAGYEEAADVLERQCAADPDYSAQVAAHVDGELVLDAWGGRGLGRDSLLCVFSVSKGVSAICLAILVERGLLDLDAPVVRYWPEFGQHGKQHVLVRELLSHRAGLVEADGGLSWAELTDDARGAARLAAQRPFWRPGIGWSYHALALGVLMNELCRRVTGESLQSFYEREVRASRDIDFYLGLPAELETRVAPVVIPDVPPAPPTPKQVIDLIVSPLLLDPGLDHLANSRESHAVGMPAAGGVASARGIARLYASVMDDLGAPRLLTDATVDDFGQIQSAGTDLFSGQPGRFGVVFQKPFAGRPFAGHRAIGHDGAAGALGFVDPANRLAFGYTTNRMAPAGGERRADEIAAALALAIR
ncbi:serine hydrolase domain-containing protein [uncultured Schumannella sp.]|uniref:serine hydrolase domain-containing protein n=1 Tax=uncultured Schumannella sp. TaxID=1195956 RepID=UPI0025EB3647|nr:serine hydrolase domain-containing protein [uncultured Schumannella sp.]